MTWKSPTGRDNEVWTKTSSRRWAHITRGGRPLYEDATEHGRNVDRVVRIAPEVAAEWKLKLEMRPLYERQPDGNRK